MSPTLAGRSALAAAMLSSVAMADIGPVAARLGKVNKWTINEVDDRWGSSITTSSLRHPSESRLRAIFDEVQWKWAKEYKTPLVPGWSSTIETSYDLKKKAKMLSDASMTGQFAHSKVGSVGYGVVKDFVKSSTTYQLRAASPTVGGCRLEMAYDTAAQDNLHSVSVPMGWKLGEDCAVSAKTEWLVGAKAMKYAANVKAWGSKLKGSISHRVSKAGPALAWEVTAEQLMSEATGLRATLDPKTLLLEYIDDESMTGFWEVAATMRLEKGWKEAFNDPEVRVKRGFRF